MSWIIEQVLAQQQNQNTFDLMIGTPTRSGEVSFKWHRSNKELRVPPGWKIVEAGETGQPIDVSRNIILIKALIGRAKFCLFWDSDVLVQPDALEQLLQLRVPVVSALIRSRGPPFQFLANVGNIALPEQVLEQPPGIIEVEEISMGFTLIDMRAIKRYAMKLNKWQCLKNHIQEAGTQVAQFDDNAASKNGYICPYCKHILFCQFFDYRAGKTSKLAISEDYYFCRNLKEKTGLKQYVFTGVKAIHESTFSEVHAEKPILVSSLNSASDIT